MEQELDQFGRKYPPKRGDQYAPSVTTDAVVFRKRQDCFHDILLITRGAEPHKGKHAFPGGFLDYNEEPQNGCLRELKEECDLDGIKCQLLTVAGAPNRDPREHIISIVYLVQVADDAKPKAGDDAATAQFYPLQDVLIKKDQFAFDHYEILLKALPKLDAKYKI